MSHSVCGEGRAVCPGKGDVRESRNAKEDCTIREGDMSSSLKVNDAEDVESWRLQEDCFV